MRCGLCLCWCWTASGTVILLSSLNHFFHSLNPLCLLPILYFFFLSNFFLLHLYYLVCLDNRFACFLASNETSWKQIQTNSSYFCVAKSEETSFKREDLMLSRGCSTLLHRWKTCIFLRSTPGPLHSPNPSQHYPITSLKSLLSASTRHISKCIHTGIIFLGKPIWPWLKRVLHELLTGPHMSTIRTLEWRQLWNKIIALSLVLKPNLKQTSRTDFLVLN